MDRNASKYETIWSAEDGEREEILSETDVDSTHLEHEKQHWQNEEGLHHARRWRSNKPPGIIATIKAWRWVIDTSLLLVITGLLVVLLLRERVHLQAGSGGPQVGSDFTGSEKTFSTKTVKWNADYSFVPTNTSEFFTDAMVDKWNTMMPNGASRPGGPQGTEFSTTSMTHQLHCLFMMGRIYSLLREHTEISDKAAEDYHTHYLHCIDYLRQAVMCAGDTSLEPHSANDGKDLGPLDGGWNGIHVCKNYDEVTQYLEEQIKDGVRVVLPIDD